MSALQTVARYARENSDLGWEDVAARCRKLYRIVVSDADVKSIVLHGKVPK